MEPPIAKDELCRRCKGVGLDPIEWERKLQNNRSTSYYSPTLGTLGELRAHKSCPFCRLVLAAISQFAKHPQDFNESDEVRLNWCVEPAGYSIECGLWVASGTRLAFAQAEEDEADEGGSETSQPEFTPYDTELAIRRARIVEDDEFLYPFYGCNWLENCKEYHGKQCAPLLDYLSYIFLHPSGRGRGHAFRLIDVRDLCIVEFGAIDVLRGVKPEYAALSYVWGGVSSLQLLNGNREEFRLSGLKSRRAEIPKTVLDAIELTRDIGLNYLWVDALCLIQDNPRDKGLALPLMHLVYGGAEITIIAAAGPDANTGLPGVNGTPRRGKQMVQEVLPGVKMAVLNDLNDMLQNSIYSTRGWTFQEQLLANRTIVFTPDGSVFFRCLHSVWSEDTNDDERPTVVTFEPDYLYMALSEQVSPALAYDGLLLDYTKRSLTRDSDILNAFAGLQSQLEDRFGDGPFLDGIPAAALNFYIIFSGHFVVLKRRAGFPSWSWAGWIGAVRLEIRGKLHDSEYVKNWLAAAAWIRWFKSLASTRPKLEPVSSSNVSRKAFDNKYCPGLDAAFTTPTLEGQLSAPDSPSVTTLHFWTVAAQFMISRIDAAPVGREFGERGIIVDRDGSVIGSVHVDDHFIEPQTIAQPFDFIVLSQANETQGGSVLVDERPYVGPGSEAWDLYWVMLVKWDDTGTVAERRGIGQIYQTSLASGCEPGPVWKEVILA